MSCKCVCHAVRSRDAEAVWLMLCQRVTSSNIKMAVLAFVPRVRTLLEKHPIPHVGVDVAHSQVLKRDHTHFFSSIPADTEKQSETSA